MSYEDDFLASGKHIHYTMKQTIMNNQVKTIFDDFGNVKDMITYLYYGLYMIKKNKQESFELTSLCAADNNEDCQVRLAYILTFDQKRKDTARAFKLIKTLVSKNNPAAISLLGYYFYKGIQIDKNIKKALLCFKRTIIRIS